MSDKLEPYIIITALSDSGTRCDYIIEAVPLRDQQLAVTLCAGSFLSRPPKSQTARLRSRASRLPLVRRLNAIISLQRMSQRLQV
jgi:hypothetical protein